MNSKFGRLAGVGAVLGLGVFAVTLAAPREAAAPEFFESVELDAEVSALASVWYCPWVNEGSTRKSTFLLASAADVDATFTLPDPRQGEPAGQSSIRIVGQGARTKDVETILRRGDAPGFVEFSDGPATASVSVEGATGISGDRCVVSVPKLWHIPGATTREGYALTLRLFNPFPDNAKVSVNASSELGPEALPDLKEVDVVGRGWKDIDLNAAIPFLDEVALTVQTDVGTVIPTVIQDRGSDEASWPGTDLSTEWYFATASLGSLTPRLSVWNPGDVPVDVVVDLYTTTAKVSRAFEVSVPAGSPVSVPIGDQSPAAVGLRVSATGAVSAAVVAEDTVPETSADGEVEPVIESRILATVGAVSPARSWLLAGAGALTAGDSSVWVLNTQDESVTVTLQPLGVAPHVPEKVVMEPNTVRRYRLSQDSQVGGYRVDASAPVVASWTIQSEQAAALFSGVAIGE